MVQAFYKGRRVHYVNSFDQKTVEIAYYGSDHFGCRTWVCPEDIIVVDLPESEMYYDD